jgi:hypothetical protein
MLDSLPISPFGLLMGIILTVQTVTGEEPSVPADDLVPPVRAFEAPPIRDVTAYVDLCHRQSERGYAGGGLWVESASKGELQLLRFTSRRVLAYLAAVDAETREIYLQRTREGLELILERQEPDGSFIWYNHGPTGPRDPGGRQYEGGIAGRALVAGYERFGDERYLDASRRLLEWELDSLLDPNNNYNMFAVWHMAAHYRVTGDRRALESAVYRTREAGLRRQQGSGGWPDHNSWIWYHSIIVRGLAELIGVMPEDHPLLPEFRKSLVRAVNRIILEQEGSGRVPPNPGSDRYAHGGYTLQALIAADRAGDLDLSVPIHGLAAWMLGEADLPEASEETSLEAGSEEGARETGEGEADRAADERTRPGFGPYEFGDPVYIEDFEGDMEEAEHGVLPPGWFVAWHPGYEPNPGENRILLNRDYSGSEKPCLQLSSKTHGTVCWGVGRVLPEGTMDPGKWYRLTVRTAGDEPVNSDGRIYCMLATVRHLRDLESRDVTLPWDEAALRTPTVGYFSDLSADFEARNVPVGIYIWFQSRQRPRVGRCGIFIDRVEIRPFTEEPEWPPDAGGPGASEMAAMADYWRWRVEGDSQ